MFSANMRSQQALAERDRSLEELNASFEHRLRAIEEQREQELSALQARATRTVQQMQEQHREEIQRLTQALEQEEKITQAERKRNAELQVVINNLRSEREQRRSLGRHTEEELVQQLDAARAEALKLRTEADVLSQRLQLRERLFTQEKKQMEAEQQARDAEMERAQRAWKERLLDLEVQLERAAPQHQAMGSPRGQQPAPHAQAPQAPQVPQTWSPAQMQGQSQQAARMAMPQTAHPAAPVNAWGPNSGGGGGGGGGGPGSPTFWGPGAGAGPGPCSGAPAASGMAVAGGPPATMAAFPPSFGAPGPNEAGDEFGMSWPESQQQQPDTPPIEGRRHKKKDKKRHTPRDQARDGGIVEAPNFDRRFGSSGVTDGPQREQRAADVASLVGMGFNEDQVQQALVETNGDVEKAVALMLAGGGVGTPEASASPMDFAPPPGGSSAHHRSHRHHAPSSASSPQSGNGGSMAGPQAVQELVSMGFAEPQVRSALQRAHGDVEVALGYLLQNFAVDSV